MRIDHAAMYVQDLEATKEFYIKYFNAEANDLYHNPKTGIKTYFLSFQYGSRLEIMTRPELPIIEKDCNLAVPAKPEPCGVIKAGYIHLAFSVGGKKEVDTLTQKLKDDGYQVISEPRTTGDGYYESCILDAEGNQIEIVE